MRLYVPVLMAFLILADVVLGGVGEVGVSDGSTAPSYQASPVSASSMSTGSQAQSINSVPDYGSGKPAISGYGAADGYSGSSNIGGYQAGSQDYQASRDFNVPDYSGLGTQGSFQGNKQASYQGSPKVTPLGSSQIAQAQIPQASSMALTTTQTSFASGAPQISGPYQEGYSPDSINLQKPMAESFQPDSNLNFISAALPSGISVQPYSTQVSGSHVSGYQGTGTGTSSWYYPGALYSGNKFYVQASSGLGTTAGCSLGGYLPIWSDIAVSGNFYVYEWYPGQTTPLVRWWGWAWPGFKKGWFNGDVPGWHVLCYNSRDWSNYIYIYVWPGPYHQGSSYQGQQYQGSYQGPYTGQGQYPGQQYPQSGYASTLGQDSSLSAGAPMPPDINSEKLVMPDYNLLSQSGYASQYQMVSQYQSQMPSQVVIQSQAAVYPKCTSYKANEYYVQAWPGKLDTVAGVKCGQWLPIWSNIARPGNYWSFEWYQCQGFPSGYYCQPEVKNFGYKVAGWYQTWFCGNKPGWHILCYCSNDWSNYVYLYVWPTS